MKHYIVRLKFALPVRFGADSSGIGIEKAQPFVHSDTLFSALCNAWSKYHILSSAEIKSCCSKFLLSSTSFYRYDSGYFLPKPLAPCAWLNKLKSSEKGQLEKILKNTAWITSEMFLHWLNPYPPKGVFFENPQELSKKLDYGALYREHIVAKHAQDRLTSASNLFHETQYAFKNSEYDEPCGLFFFVSLKDDSFKETFDQGLKALSQIGLGGERNFGLGRFEVDDENGFLCPIEDDGSELAFLFEDSPSSQKCLLSLSLPLESEINTLKKVADKNILRYDLTLRKGWAFSSINFHQMKRQTLYMLSEGSVFENCLCPEGRIEDVAPLDKQKNQSFPHPVFRFGKSFSVPLKSY